MLRLELVGSRAGGVKGRFMEEVRTGGKRKEVVKNRLEWVRMIGRGLPQRKHLKCARVLHYFTE